MTTTLSYLKKYKLLPQFFPLCQEILVQNEQQMKFNNIQTVTLRLSHTNNKHVNKILTIITFGRFYQHNSIDTEPKNVKLVRYSRLLLFMKKGWLYFFYVMKKRVGSYSLVSQKKKPKQHESSIVNYKGLKTVNY